MLISFLWIVIIDITINIEFFFYLIDIKNNLYNINYIILFINPLNQFNKKIIVNIPDRNKYRLIFVRDNNVLSNKYKDVISLISNWSKGFML